MRILITWLCLVSACAAGWDTNIWPSWEVQRKGRQHAQECYTAIVERCEITYDSVKGTTGSAGVTDPTAPTWWRFQRTMLINYKAKTEELLLYFVRGSTNYLQVLAGTNNVISRYTYPGSEPYYDVTNSTLYDYYVQFPSTGDGVYWMLPHYSVTNLCMTLNLPTNFFDYTPWRCLNGLGGFTNDASVGRGHGWTNASTANGGANFPSGRGTWYTTDYGWDGLRQAISLLTATELPADYNIGSTNYHTSASISSNGFPFSVYSDAEDSTTYGWDNPNWTNSIYLNYKIDADRAPFKDSQSWQNAYDDYRIYVGAGYNRFIGTKGTNTQADTEWFVWAGFPSYTFSAGYAETHTFNSYSDGFNVRWNSIGKETMPATSKQWYLLQGDTSLTRPGYLGDPGGTSIANDYGYGLYAPFGVAAWQFSYTNSP